MNSMQIQPYSPKYEADVIELWRKCDLLYTKYNPYKDIARKMKVDPELFLIGVEGGKVIATVMGGYDGHRGWIYHLGIDPAYQRRGLGRQIMDAIEEKLKARDCLKVNLMVMKTNHKAMKFYESIGFNEEDATEYGKRLLPD